ncbi:MAG: DinB family protein [Candidatus Heimdallarchaeota archaeon]
MSKKNFIIQMFKYNKWANSRYRGVLRNVPIDNLQIATEYGQLLDRIVHIFASYEMWYKRLQDQSPNAVIKSSYFSNWVELESKWIEMDDLLIDYVKTISEELLTETVRYVSLDGKEFTRKREDILFHLVQHPSYHRGQLSSYFKHSELPNFPATDVVIYLTAHDRDDN